MQYIIKTLLFRNLFLLCQLSVLKRGCYICTGVGDWSFFWCGVVGLTVDIVRNLGLEIFKISECVALGGFLYNTHSLIGLECYFLWAFGEI